MPFALGNNNFLILAVLVFVAVLLLLEGLYMLWRSHKGPEATKFKKRLRALSASSDRTAQTQLLKQRMLSDMPVFDRILQSVPRMHALERFLLQSGLNWTVSKLLLACAACGAAGWVAITHFANQSMATGLLVAAATGILPVLYVRFKRERRLAWIERQLPETLDLLTRALRAGHAFTAGLKMAGEEMVDPIAGEFRTVHDEINFGVSLEQALSHLSERVPLTDLRYFVVAVLIQRDSGGNLTEILTDLAQLIRERAKLLGKVRVLSSEGRMSAWILGLMPFFIAGVVNLANPKFMNVMWTDPLGISITKYMLILMAFGALIMRKIIRIRV